MITPDLIERRLNNFWGYGSLGASVWFVGMEEGLGPTTDVAELEERFRTADGRTTIDMRRDMSRVPDHMQWFRPGARLQTTWKYPIALYLYLKKGCEPTQEEIRTYQVVALADMKLKQTSVIDLMPLPSRNTDHSAWLYKTYSVKGLGSRSEYLSSYTSRRVQQLKKLVSEHKPKLLIFCSVSYLPYWKEVIGKHLEAISSQMYFTQATHIAYCVLPQGAGFGMSYRRLYEYGAAVAGRVRLPD